MTESEQKYGDFREDFRESTTVTLKKIEIQNEILKVQINTLQHNLLKYKTIAFILTFNFIISCIIIWWNLL
jgi:hypothetical protein